MIVSKHETLENTEFNFSYVLTSLLSYVLLVHLSENE